MGNGTSDSMRIRIVTWRNPLASRRLAAGKLSAHAVRAAGVFRVPKPS